MNFRRRFLWLLFALILAACGRDAPFFKARSIREEVYRTMGAPANTDDQIVAVWGLDGAQRHGKTWRQIFDDGKDGWFAVFDSDNRSLLPRLSFSASTVESEMTDQEVLAWATKLKAEGWGQ